MAGCIRESHHEVIREKNGEPGAPLFIAQGQLLYLLLPLPSMLADSLPIASAYFFPPK